MLFVTDSGQSRAGDEDTVLICCGEERADLKIEDVESPVDVGS